MKNTTSMTKNMTPAIIFGNYGWNFVFVDTKAQTWLQSEDATKVWLKKNGITPAEFTNYVWSEYNYMKDSGVKCGLMSYFTKDDEKIYNFAKTIDVNKFYNEAFNF